MYIGLCHDLITLLINFLPRVPSTGRITLLAARERPFRLGIHFFDFQMSAPPMNIFRGTNVIERVQLSLPARKLLRWCLQRLWKGKKKKKKVKSKGKNHVCSHLFFFFFFFNIHVFFLFFFFSFVNRKISSIIELKLRIASSSRKFKFRPPIFSILPSVSIRNGQS